METEFDNQKVRLLDGGLLLIFRELVRRRKASDVAVHLGLSPSAISHALTRLRDVFGDPLFLRRSHGLEPTQRALDLAPRVETLIGLLGEAVARDGGFDPARSRRRFRIVCPDEIATLAGERLVETFRRDAPDASFSARPAILGRALRAVRRGEADLALGVFPSLLRGLSAEDLYDDEYCVIARQDHPAIDGRIDARTYRQIGHLFVGNPDGQLSEDSPIDRELLDETYGELPGADAVRTQGYVAQWESAMLIVSSSDIVADCPRRLARRHRERLELQVLDPPYRPFRFTVRAVRRAGAADPGVDWLLARLREAIED